MPYRVGPSGLRGVNFKIKFFGYARSKAHWPTSAAIVMAQAVTCPGPNLDARHLRRRLTRR
jgi:hypothetical protein